MKPEAPVVAIVIEKPSQLVDSLTNNPPQDEFKVNQVSFTCELILIEHALFASEILH